MMEEAFEPGGDAIAVVCTNFAAAPLVVDFETEFDTAVFDTFHHCVGACGVADPDIRGWGKALADRALVG